MKKFSLAEDQLILRDSEGYVIYATLEDIVDNEVLYLEVQRVPIYNLQGRTRSINPQKRHTTNPLWKQPKRNHQLSVLKNTKLAKDVGLLTNL